MSNELVAQLGALSKKADRLQREVVDLAEALADLLSGEEFERFKLF
jgi:hypothetical protein